MIYFSAKASVCDMYNNHRLKYFPELVGISALIVRSYFEDTLTLSLTLSLSSARTKYTLSSFAPTPETKIAQFENDLHFLSLSCV